nr:ribonuclease H-like domain-containing protein [Tanacetum cinerariifolium]
STKEELVIQKEEMELENYALCDVIENGNSFKPVAETTTYDAGTSTTIIQSLVTIEKKAKKKNDVNARSMLLMALPNEHLMTFNQHKDVKTLFAAIEATKKTQKTLLKQFTASPQVSIANLSDATVYAFLANQPNRSQLVHEDLEQILEDDLEKMDLKWQLALLSMRAKRDSFRILMGHFARECRVLRNHENRTRNQETTDNECGNLSKQWCKSGLGYVSYNDVPPPYTGRFSPPRIDLSHTGLPEFAEPSVKSYGVTPIEVVTQASSVKLSALVKKTLARCKYHQRERMVNGTNHLRVNHNATTVPKAMLTRTGLKHVNSVRPVNYKRNFFNKINTSKEKVNTARPNSVVLNVVRIEDQGYFNSECSRHMTRNISYLTDFKEFDGGYVAFGGGAKGVRLLAKMCDKKNSVLFTDTECFVLSHDFKLADESHVLLKVPRKNNMYCVDMKNIVPKKDLTCLVAKISNDKSMLWHRRLGHINFKNINKLVKDNLNMVLVVKPHFKTPYELFRGKTLALSFMRPFGCHVTILNSLDHLGKFDGDGPKWLFDIDTLIESMNYVPVSA